MTSKYIATGILASLLAGCGGGGGGGGVALQPTSAAAPAAVQITEANALPVGAHAVETAQDTSTSQGTVGLLGGVQVESAAQQHQPLPWLLAQVARAAAGTAPTALATGISVDQTESCDAGGSIRVSGNVSSSSGLSRGDNVQMRATACVMRVGSITMTIDGSMSFAVTDGFLPASGNPPFRVVLSVITDGLAVREGTTSVTSTGDASLDWTEASTGTTLVATGNALTSRVGGRGSTLRNYRQTVLTSGDSIRGSVSGTVETDSTRIGPGGGSYTLATLTDLQWRALDPSPTAGVLGVTGAAGSQLRITFAAGSATVTVDANGDGTFERTFTTTAADLRSRL